MVEIKCLFTDRVLFAHDGDSIKIAVEAAVQLRSNLGSADLSGAVLSFANLHGADLRGAHMSCANLSSANMSFANLIGADLIGVNLGDANLSSANLIGANLNFANLRGANLSSANLVGADLSGADLSGAYLRDGVRVSGLRPLLQLGPLGSRSRYLAAWITTGGVMIRVGCFWGTRDAFAEKVLEFHGNNVHAQEYAAALMLIDAHARLWTPKAGE